MWATEQGWKIGLDVIDVASGASTRLALGAGFWTLRPTNAAAVSSDGRWVTFMIGIPTDGGSSQYVLVVAGADGRVETLASQPSAYDAGFVSDRLLLFQTGAWSSEIRGHVPGTGDTSYLVAANRDPGQFGYVVSPDGTRLLGAAMTTEYIYELYAIRLDGSGELLLAPDLVSFQLFEMPIRAFAFSAGGRAIYLSDRPFGVATVSLDGGKPTKLSGGAYFREAPRLDQVALVEPTSLAPAASRLRLVDLEYGTDVFAYDSDGGVETVGFPPSGRDLVFTEYGPPGRTQLRYASADQSGVLGEWMTTQFQPDVSYFAMSLEVHPVDPTGCFTVFDTDLTPGPGTRLAILPPD